MTDTNAALNVTVEWTQLCSVFEKSWVQILACDRPTWQDLCELLIPCRRSIVYHHV